MKTSSCKAKGRRLQQHVAQRIREHFILPESDVKSLPMGAQGEDIWLSKTAREFVPFSIECKAHEKIAIWAAYEQAKTHGDRPLVVFTRNRSEVLCTLSFEDLLKILGDRPRPP